MLDLLRGSMADLWCTEFKSSWRTRVKVPLFTNWVCLLVWDSTIFIWCTIRKTICNIVSFAFVKYISAYFICLLFHALILHDENEGNSCARKFSSQRIFIQVQTKKLDELKLFTYLSCHAINTIMKEDTAENEWNTIEKKKARKDYRKDLAARKSQEAKRLIILVPEIPPSDEHGYKSCTELKLYGTIVVTVY